MRCVLTVGLIVAAWAGAGCGQKAPPPRSGWVKFHSGRYDIEVESANGGGFEVTNDTTDDGGGKDLVEISWDALKLRIENGNLTINGKGRGTVVKGDRVKIDGTGRVSVNGTER